LAGTCCSFGGYPLRKRPSPSGGESVTPGFENGQVPLGENQSPRVSKTAKSLWGRISHPKSRKQPSPSGGESVSPSSSGGESVTPSFDNGRVPQEENQSPRVSKTAKSLWGRISLPEFLRRRISHPESRKRPSPSGGESVSPSSSGGESVTPSFDNGRVPQEENQSPRVSKTAKSLWGRISHSESRQRPSPSGGESVTPSFENGQVHPGEKIDFDHVRLPPFSLPRLATDAYGYVEQENREEGAGNNWVSSGNA
jgi:hypothetical protein